MAVSNTTHLYIGIMREKCYTSSNSADSSVDFIRGRNRLEISNRSGQNIESICTISE